MIHVIAIITAKPGQRGAVLEAARQNLAAVRAEKGCIQYLPAIDAPGFAFQTEAGDDTFFVIEQWADAAALNAHAVAPHMKAYGARVKDLIAKREIFVLSSAE